MTINAPGTDNNAIRDLRDDLRDLNKTIKRANVVNGRMTILLFIVAFFQLFITTYQLSIMVYGNGSKSTLMAVFLTALIGTAMYFLTKRYIKTEKSGE